MAEHRPRRIRPALLLGALAASAGAAPVAEPAPVDPGEIVVTGRRGSPGVQPDAVEILRTFCFDPARRTGRMAPPDEKLRWYPLEDQARRRFRIEDPDAPAFSRTDRARGQELWLKLETFDRPHRLIEQRCTLLVIGGSRHGRFVGDMSRLFRGRPTQRHVGDPAGSPKAPGWEQWLWTGMPPRRSSDWRSTNQRGTQDSWLVVVDTSFYREYDYFIGDLKLHSDPARPLALLTLAVIRGRPWPAPAARR
jgi:hypothetical protein